MIGVNNEKWVKTNWKILFDTWGLHTDFLFTVPTRVLKSKILFEFDKEKSSI